MAQITSRDFFNDLCNLISNGDDSVINVLWVDNSGQVHLSPLPQSSGNTIQGWIQQQPNYKFSFESYMAGNDYVGPSAGADSNYMNKIQDDIMRHWSNNSNTHLDCF